MHDCEGKRSFSGCNVQPVWTFGCHLCIFAQQTGILHCTSHTTVGTSAFMSEQRWFHPYLQDKMFIVDYSWSVGIQKYSTTFLLLRWGAESGRSPPKAGSSSKWLGPRSLPVCGAETLSMVLRWKWRNHNWLETRIISKILQAQLVDIYTQWFPPVQNEKEM